jgi:hypothetical protein
MRRGGDVIIFDLAQREGDWLKLGVDLKEHICNIFGLGEAERRRFDRRQRRRYKQNRATGLLHRQTLLMDRLAWLLWWKGKEIRITRRGRVGACCQAIETVRVTQPRNEQVAGRVMGARS